MTTAPVNRSQPGETLPVRRLPSTEVSPTAIQCRDSPVTDHIPTSPTFCTPPPLGRHNIYPHTRGPRLRDRDLPPVDTPMVQYLSPPNAPPLYTRRGAPA